MTLTEKYRPRTLADLVGQPWAVHQLTEFVANPVATAFLFEGDTGTGKTSAALALAHDLGVDVTAGPFGGFHEIASGEQTAESVRRVMDGLRLHTLSGSGWKVLVVNEADCMSPQASYIWLDALENLPARTVVVFTTNHAAKLPARLRDRCERFRFEAGYLALAPYLPELIAKVWAGEGCTGDPPDLDALGPLQDENGNVSVRRVIQALVPWVRHGGNPVGAAAGEPGGPPIPESVRAAKARHPGMVLLFRDGERYRTFGADRAVVASACGTADLPVAGVEANLRKLLRAGHRVAVCDSAADGAAAVAPAPVAANNGPAPAFDAAAVLARRQAGESWQRIAGSLGLPETTVRGRMNRLAKRGSIA